MMHTLHRFARWLARKTAPPFLPVEQGMLPLDAYRRLTGAAVVTSPAFKENLLGFAGCYGLCVQALDKSKLKTNLILMIQKNLI